MNICKSSLHAVSQAKIKNGGILSEGHKVINNHFLGLLKRFSSEGAGVRILVSQLAVQSRFGNRSVFPGTGLHRNGVHQSRGRVMFLWDVVYLERRGHRITVGKYVIGDWSSNSDVVWVAICRIVLGHEIRSRFAHALSILVKRSTLGIEVFRVQHHALRITLKSREIGVHPIMQVYPALVLARYGRRGRVQVTSMMSIAMGSLTSS